MDSSTLNELLSALHVEPLGAVVSFLIDNLDGYVIDSLIDDNYDYSDMLISVFGWEIADYATSLSDYMSEAEFILLLTRMKNNYEQVQYNNVDVYTVYELDNFLRSENVENIIGSDERLSELLNIENLGVYDYSLYKNKVVELFADYGYTLIIGTNGNNVIASEKDKVIVFGGEGSDVVYGNDNDDVIYGGYGSDVIVGDKGNDTIYADDIQYSILGNEDRIYGGDGDDMIYAGSGDDVINGDNDNDIIFGGYGDDKINGDVGDDTIFGENDDDIIDGGTGIDRIYGGEGNDIINGGVDKDFIYGEVGVDTINGGSGNDIIYGGDNDDELYESAGDDIIFGGDGWDDLDGEYGDDTLRGGDRSDTHYFRKFNGSDNIYDQYGTNTVVFEGIELSDLSIAYSGTYQQNLEFTIISTGKTLTIIDYMHTDDSFKYKFDGESGYYTVETNDGVLSFEKIESSHSGSGYDTHWDKLLDNTSNNNIDIYESATVAQPPRDPLVIDLGEDGIELTTIDDGVYFDLDKNGFAEKLPGLVQKMVSLCLIATVMVLLMMVENFSAIRW